MPDPPPRRVLLLDHTAQLGGGELALLNLARHLDRARYEPIACLFEDGPLVGHLRAAGIETRVLPLDARVAGARKDDLAAGAGKLARGVAAGRFALGLARLVRQLRPDVVHCNSLKSDVLGGLAARLARAPCVWHVRDRIADDYLPPRVARAFRAAARRLPTHVVAISGAVRDALALPPGRVTVVHDGTDVPPDPPPPAAGAGRVGLVGRVSPWKGQDVFLRAAARLRDRFPAARFVIAGSALFGERDYEARVRALADELKLGGAVEFAGFVRDVPALMRSLDVVAHASTLGEPFGQVIVEAMAQARPVVATRGGGVPEIVADGATGLLVPMGDDAALADALARLLADPPWSAALGRAGHARAVERFALPRVAREVEATWAALAALRR